MRATAKAVPEARPEDFAILVRDIPRPKDESRKEQVDSYFRTLHPDTFYKSIVVTDNKEVITDFRLSFSISFFPSVVFVQSRKMKT